MFPKPLIVLALIAGCSEYDLSQNPPALGAVGETTAPAPDAKGKPEIRIDPENHDFGTPWVGCEVVQPFDIHNDGDAKLIVDELLFDGPGEFVFSHDLELPVTIAPGDHATVELSYLGDDEWAEFAELVAFSNDPERPEVSATAKGSAASDRRTDAFDQPTQPQSDILVVVDNSCSMAEEQANLTANFQTFVDAVVAANADFRIGVITTDNPSFRGPMITPATPNPVGTFAGQANAGIGGAGDERPLQRILESLQGDAAPGGAFFRDDAVLSIVVVTDEPDEYSITTPTDVVNYLVGLKSGATNLVKFHTIGGDVPVPACATAAQGSWPMDQVSALSGGLFLSVCGNWGSSLNAVAAGSVPLADSFALTSQALAGSIEVMVDGVVETSGWSYNPGTQSVVFDPNALPPQGAVVEISYEPVHDCTP